MAYISEPLYRLSKTCIRIGGTILAFSLAVSAMLIVESLSNPRVAPTDAFAIAVGLFVLYGLTGLAAVVLGRLVQDGHLWAAIALVAVALIDGGKFLLLFLLFGFAAMFSCAMLVMAAILGLLSLTLIIRCTIAIPEIRHQLRARRTSYERRGFEPLVNRQTGLQPPPRALKQAPRSSTP